MTNNFELKIDDKLDDASIFQNSCKAAIIINTLTDRIAENTNIANTRYVDDHEFVSNYENNNYSSSSTGVNVFIGIVTAVITFFLVVFFWEKTKLSVNFFTYLVFFIVWAGLFILVKSIIRKIKINKLTKEAVCLLPKYRNERDNFNNIRKPALLAQIKDDNELLKEAANFLREISDYRNCITKEYYHCAGELLYLYRVKRADNLKEAINVWENIQFQLRQAEVLSEVSATVAYNAQLAEEACEYARQASIEARNASVNSEINSLMLFLNMID